MPKYRATRFINRREAEHCRFDAVSDDQAKEILTTLNEASEYPMGTPVRTRIVIQRPTMKPSCLRSGAGIGLTRQQAGPQWRRKSCCRPRCRTAAMQSSS